MPLDPACPPCLGDGLTVCPHTAHTLFTHLICGVPAACTAPDLEGAAVGTNELFWG